MHRGYGTRYNEFLKASNVRAKAERTRAYQQTMHNIHSANNLVDEAMNEIKKTIDLRLSHAQEYAVPTKVVQMLQEEYDAAERKAQKGREYQANEKAKFRRQTQLEFQKTETDATRAVKKAEVELGKR